MTLPTYADLFEWMHGRGMEPLPAPDLEATRVGLARYSMKCAYVDLYADDPEWDRIYRSCLWAQQMLQQVWHIRVPASSFHLERLRVDEMLSAEMRPATSTPVAADDRGYQRKVLRWARRG